MSESSERVALITGAAGGIGAATARTLVRGRHARSCSTTSASAAGSTELADELGDAAHARDGRPARPDRPPTRCGTRRWRGAATSTSSSTTPASTRRPSSTATSQAWQESWERTLAICLVSPAALCRAAIHSFRAAARRRHHRQPREPRGAPRRGSRLLALRRREGGRGRDDEDHRAPVRPAGCDGVRHLAGLRRHARSTRPLVEEHGIDLFVNDTALGEVAQPQDIANVIAFLASGKARHATGHDDRRQQRELRPLSQKRIGGAPLCAASAQQHTRTAHVARSARLPRALHVWGLTPEMRISGVRPQP